MEEEEISSLQEIGDLAVKKRVMRADGVGIQGVVVSIREDALATGDKSEQGIVVGVRWDNGTYSYFTPERLKPADAARRIECRASRGVLLHWGGTPSHSHR